VQVIEGFPKLRELLDTLALLGGAHLHDGRDGGLVGALEDPRRDPSQALGSVYRGDSDFLMVTGGYG
jgi:hypothetical protein